MKTKEMMSRRNFLQLSAGAGLLAGLSRFELEASAAQQDYKALVCVFLFGGNDGHNVVVPLNPTQYTAYQQARGALTMPQNQLLPINDPAQGAFGLHYGLPELQSLYLQGKMTVVANAGMLVRPTTYQEYQNAFQLPTQLRSHSDQVSQMQTGFPNTGGSTGWGGRTADLMTANNLNATFPVSVSLNNSALFCQGAVVQAASLQPGNYLDQNAMNFWPATAAQARAAAQQQIVTADSGNAIVNAANKVLADAVAINPILKAAGSGTPLTTVFPSTSLGNQLKDIARIINLRSQLGVGRQVFFCGLGGFDTHSSQAYNQWDLLKQVSQALGAFYSATAEMGVADKVTSFTLSDFGRTLQPSGTGSDHGWGSHILVLGGGVNGGKICGSFPNMLNYAAVGSGQQDFADNRGTMLPRISLAQFGATLAKWFGAADSQLNGLFPTLPNFQVRDLGFMI
ncbi:MAG TPA: DUF1501 domain-containing protein [Blastocatellia bacterium]|nr:DUF1501 domain-containing protein [Blastocatellia bacterium]HMV83533.1 DUF1501 domain-containing protein [Blastocatellia bacterium]HMX28747.1 DUF1501 domain-containing protein [Blastocatellia bacterium]HMZ21628.1 DUF1501 domain-containing protein [Blastocatellia bacterium]